MKVNKDDMVALAGTIAIHALVAVLLFFLVLRTIVPDEEEGVLVNFGNISLSAGLFEPRGGAPERDVESVPSPPPVAASTTRQPEEIISQDTEETVSITDRQREEDRKRREEAERREQERLEAERRQEEERRRREQAISDQVSGAFGSGNAGSESQGDSEGTGNQGSPFGNADTGENRGIGGMGEFSLSGRSIRGGGLPRPAYTIQEEGRIVIDITVDPRGSVIIAEIGKGTNIDNASMRASALEAARRARFNSISGTNNQSGTITYRYSLK
ncbi:MAG: energy transducer TonB [Tannerella sp.]|jgi:TonB family protein|nr:energy transducer TonB [Tannerella sp.]